MPTYDYICDSCGHRFEHFQAMGDSLLEKCPLCNGRVKRLISGGAGLIFKGSGFYITDYARKSARSEQDTSSKSTKKEPKKDSDS